MASYKPRTKRKIKSSEKKLFCFRFIVMKLLIILLFLLICPAYGETFKGRGYAKYARDYPQLSRVVATMDAINDALVKMGGELTSDTELERSGIVKSRTTLKKHVRGYAGLKRSCKHDGDGVVCHVVLPKNSYSGAVQNLDSFPEPRNCRNVQSHERFRFCYRAHQVSHSSSTHGVSANARFSLSVGWKLGAHEHIVKQHTYFVRGFGKDKEKAYRSAFKQWLKHFQSEKRQWLAAIEAEKLKTIIHVNTTDEAPKITGWLSFLAISGIDVIPVETGHYLLIPKAILEPR